MMIRAFNLLRGIVCTFLIVLNLFIHGTLTLIFGGLAWLLSLGRSPWKPIQWLVELIPRSWAFFNLCCIRLSTLGKFEIHGSGELHRNQWYIMISNHQSWVDILVLSGIFSLKTPPIKFFMKKELLWQLPIAGLCCYLLGYPFMQRHTRADIRKNPALKGQDIETTKKACQKFKKLPTTIINFAEGTRFTAEKHRRQESTFKNLLKPKAGGTAIVINEMYELLGGVLNVTINYDADDISFFNLVSGNIRKLSVCYELLPIDSDLLGNYYEDRIYRSKIQRWFNDIWERKDALLTELKTHD